MCGRYTLRRPGLIAKYVYQNSFEEFSDTGITPRFNIAPSQQVAAIRLDKEDKRQVGTLKWGLIPSWQPKATKPTRSPPINAKAETVATNGAFRQAFQRRRCLLPADGFFEWRDMLDGNGKTPFFIRLQSDDMFACAGLWERWSNADGEIVDTCCHITTEPNEIMAPIHNRMPVLLDDAVADRWINRETPADELLSLLRPYEGDMQVDIVSKRVSSPRNDDPDIVKPVG